MGVIQWQLQSQSDAVDHGHHLTYFKILGHGGTARCALRDCGLDPVCDNNKQLSQQLEVEASVDILPSLISVQPWYEYAHFPISCGPARCCDA